MPNKTQDAVNWALQQVIINPWGFEVQVSVDTPGLLVDKVREYFNTNNIPYETFSFDDLLPYLTN